MILRDPNTLRPHPLNALPRWAKGTPEWRTFVADIADHGVTEPLLIVGDEVVDGETRRLASIEAGRLQVPVRIAEPGEVATIMLRQLHRRQLPSESAKAFVLYPLLAPAHEELRQRHVERLRANNPSGLPKVHAVDFAPEKGTKYVEKVEDFAGNYGVSRSMFYNARDLHELFKDDKRRTITDRDGETEVDVTFAEFYTKRIMGLADGKPYGLGGIVTGIKQILDQERKAAAGQQHTGGKPKDAARQLELFTDTFTENMANRFEYWAKFDEADKTTALTKIGGALETAPEDFLAGLQAKIKAELRRREKSEQD
jgi:hypothetical protein